MRIIILITSLLILYSCTWKKKELPVIIDYTGFKDKRIKLALLDSNYEQKDTFAVISIKVPGRLDTFYQWYSTSDCLACGRLCYRFGDKHYVQFAEGGFFWTFVPDSVYQLTISHTPVKDVRDSIIIPSFTEKDSGFSYHLTGQLTGKSEKLIKHGFLNINGRGFITAAFISPFGRFTNDTTLYVAAQVNLKRNRLYIYGECGAKDTTGFIESIYKALLSIKIEER